MGFKLGSWNSLDLESEVLPIEPPRHPVDNFVNVAVVVVVDYDDH